jgi:hypothetical protein
MTVAMPTHPSVATVATPQFDARAATGSVAKRPIGIPRASVTVPAHSGESPAELRSRLHRAGARLQLMLGAGGQSANRVVLRLERPGTSTAMPLPMLAFDDQPEVFARRLPDAALRGVDAIVVVAKLAVPSMPPVSVAVA